VSFERIRTDPAQLSGQTCIRGLRIPVATVVAMVADGKSIDEIVDAYPDLEPEDMLRRCTTPRKPSVSANCQYASSREARARNNLSRQFIEALVEQGHDVEHVRDHGLHTADDETVLDRAARDRGR
jgi:uncharacterized protein (DUF433 family)